MKCKECGCDHKTKFMIKVDYDKTPNDNHAKMFFEATTKKSIVGWIKHICNEWSTGMKEIRIIYLNSECIGHYERSKKK